MSPSLDLRYQRQRATVQNFVTLKKHPATFLKITLLSTALLFSETPGQERESKLLRKRGHLNFTVNVVFQPKYFQSYGKFKYYIYCVL